MVIGLTFVGCVIAYTDRVSISVAAVVMKEHFGWTQTEKGFVLAAFFVGYLLFMFPSGLLARRFGGKRLLGCAVFVWSLFTLLTPLAAALSIPILLVARISMGVGEAAMFPAAYELFGRWAAPMERTRAVASLTSGIPIGTLLGLAGSGLLVQRFGWEMPFYVFGGCGILWMLLWLHQVANEPAGDPRIGSAELALLSAERPKLPAPRLSLRRLLLNKSMAGIVVGQFAYTWSLYVLLSWMPSYFRDVQGLSIAQSGLFSAAPWLTMFVVGNGAGVVADWMIKLGVSITRTRKIMQCIALLVSAALLLALYGAHTAGVALLLLCGATAAMACSSAGYLAIYLDIAPHESGVLFAFGNSFGTLPGIVGVAVTGWLVDVTGTYFAAFILTAIVSVGGALAFGLFADAACIEKNLA